jgi:hypothetical protein
VKNEDSLYKFLAFTGMLEKTRKEKFAKDRNLETDTVYNVNSFEEFYKDQLLLEAKKDQGREYKMDPKDY